MKTRLSIFVLALPVFAWGQIHFDERAFNSGIKHVSVATDFMGAAVAVFDYNNDGWQDLFLTGGLSPCKLYKNLGNGVFKDVTTEAGGFSEASVLKTMSVVTADLDNDGDREIIIGTARDMPSAVYRNNGNGTFTAITTASGITATKYTTAMAAGDYNLDGLIDLYFANYVLIPRVLFNSVGNVIGYAHECTPNELYVNQGNLVFVESANSLGVDNRGCGLATIFTDVDGDYTPDVFIANDFGIFTNYPDAFYKNKFPTVPFEDRSVASQLNASIFGMGIAQGDFDKDGMLDLYVTNLGRNVLHRQTSPGLFADVTTTALVEDAKDENNLNISGWGTEFFDYDNDGWDDLYISNGYIPAVKAYESGYNEENRLFHNLKNGTFENVAHAAGVDDNKIHRGMAVGDFDNDGDEDLIVTQLVPTGVPTDDNSLLYINKQATAHKWINISLRGNGNTTRDAFGSTVKVFYNNTRSLRTLLGGSSYASQSSSVLHFGLGTSNAVDSVVVFWPGGQKTKVLSPPVNNHILIEKGVAGFSIVGCANSAASNYNPAATVNSGCFFPVPGCTNVMALNYNPNANQDNNSCQFTTGLADNDHTIRLYPNPSRNEINISALSGTYYRLEMFGVRGELVFQTDFVEQTVIRPELSSGLYYYRIFENDKIIKTGKILRQN